MNLELKQVALILSLLMPAVGFYYTTNVRLDALEQKIVQLEKKVKKVAGKKSRRNKNVDRGMSAMCMLLASHDEVLKHLVDRVENLENLLQVSKGGLVQ